MKKYFLIPIFTLIAFAIYGQSQLYEMLLQDTPIDDDLRELCDQIGGRVTGSEANLRSVDWAVQKFKEAGVDVKKQAFEMPSLWLALSSNAKVKGAASFPVEIVAKYMSPEGLYSGPLIYGDYGRAKDLDSLGLHDLTGKILLVQTDICLDINGLFAEYAHASEVEIEAEKRNAEAIIFMSSRPKKLLYRFITSKGASNVMPQIVMAREDALRIQRILQDGNELNIEMDVKNKTGSNFTSYNVIGEIKGAKKPNEVVVVGAHLDSWAMGTGANDNGCNVTMLIDIARQMKKLNIQPDRTIRFALWNGEEQGYFGSLAYTIEELDHLDDHVVATSIDIGSGAITGFFTNGDEELIPLLDGMLQKDSTQTEFNHLNIPIVGTDNFDFMLQGVPNLVAIHKPASYGVNYHASSDTYDKVDIESLKRNAVTVASMILGFANMDDEKLPKRNSRQEIQKIFDENKLEFTMRMFNVWEPWANGLRGRKED